MLRLELSEEAQADLRQILIYGTANFGEEAADAYLFGFDASFDLLRNYPDAEEIEETGLGLRRWHHHNHRIFYRHDAETLFIIRIFHHAQDLPDKPKWRL